MDAPVAIRAAARAICARCPVIEVCAAEADRYGPAATGVWASVYREWTSAAPTSDDDVIAEYEAVFGPLNPMQSATN